MANNIKSRNKHTRNKIYILNKHVLNNEIDVNLKCDCRQCVFFFSFSIHVLYYVVFSVRE